MRVREPENVCSIIWQALHGYTKVSRDNFEWRNPGERHGDWDRTFLAQFCSRKRHHFRMLEPTFLWLPDIPADLLSRTIRFTAPLIQHPRSRRSLSFTRFFFHILNVHTPFLALFDRTYSYYLQGCCFAFPSICEIPHTFFQNIFTVQLTLVISTRMGGIQLRTFWLVIKGSLARISIMCMVEMWWKVLRWRTSFAMGTLIVATFRVKRVLAERFVVIHLWQMIMHLHRVSSHL